MAQLDSTPSSPPVSPGNAGRQGHLAADVLASVVVFLVALPLCMGVALASGVPPEKAASVGIITGIIGGVLVGLLGGSPFQVSGPAAGLSVVVYELARTHGYERVGLIVLIAGSIQFMAGVFKLGQWFRAVSPPVIQGMLSGIGLLIFGSQFHIMLDGKPLGGGVANLVGIPQAAWRGAFTPTGVSGSAIVAVVTLLILLFWKSTVPKKLKIVPAPLVAVIAATLVATFAHLEMKRVDLPERLLDAVQWPSLAGLESWHDWRTILAAGAAMAIIASAETLLCASAVDRMHTGQRTNYDRELAVQGLGNMLSGFLGALPMTGVIVRSSANVEAGARTKWSAVFHGVWLLVAVTLLTGVLRQVPTSALAAILVYTGVKLMNFGVARQLVKYGRFKVVIYVATVVLIVLTDLLTGVVCGLVLATGWLLHTLSHLEIQREDSADGGSINIRLRGAATFFRVPQLAKALESLPANATIHVRVEEVTFIDHACLDLLNNWKQQHQKLGGQLVLDWDSLAARSTVR
ncbi:MAG: SulP family inorganic anion transporter [Planctomycetales bacterium]|nr:SulP family inorganic anion transporter [Planctomycetales bacterium]